VCRILFWLDAVPHVAARDPHQWSLKFSFATQKDSFNTISHKLRSEGDAKTGDGDAGYADPGGAQAFGQS
jgi:hypothetical protein